LASRGLKEGILRGRPVSDHALTAHERRCRGGAKVSAPAARQREDLTFDTFLSLSRARLADLLVHAFGERICTLILARKAASPDKPQRSCHTIRVASHLAAVVGVTSTWLARIIAWAQANPVAGPAGSQNAPGAGRHLSTATRRQDAPG
jgi:hypothetical protein